jgi:hypothetical protein
MNDKWLDATVITVDPSGQETQGKKYHKIQNVESRLRKFETFAKGKFSTATHVNYYYRDKPAGESFAFQRPLSI